MARSASTLGAEPADAEALLARVLKRDGAKQLATDEHTQALSAQALRRRSTRQLRALRDELNRERAGCPPDRAAAARRAAGKAAADEQARDAEAARMPRVSGWRPWAGWVEWCGPGWSPRHAWS